VRVKEKFVPHTANLKDDYQKLHKAALQEKKETAVEQWFDTARKQVFIEIKYSECANAIKTWNPKE
jgi:peptidyl-prolyl cis-trans isomerase SurA